MAEDVAGLQRNLTDASILVGSVAKDAQGYVLTGAVVSVSPAGGSAAISETGQIISLRTFSPEGSPDLSVAGHRRLMEISGTPAGEKFRCRIGPDSRGGWRIVSAD
ncbi:MAG TPA: hypothetical protein VI932_00240 [Bacteroidota bacterium]|nr:hypothetical protein [Bacteroidota bacterium]